MISNVISSRRSALGSSSSPTRSYNQWYLEFLLGDPVRWDPSVLTLESEGGFESSMQVRRLAGLEMHSYHHHHHHHHHHERANFKLQQISRLLTANDVECLQACLEKSDALILKPWPNHWGWACGSFWLCHHGSGSPAFGVVILPSAGDFRDWIWHHSHAQGRRSSEYFLAKAGMKMFQVYWERLFHRADDVIVTCFKTTFVRVEEKQGITLPASLCRPLPFCTLVVRRPRHPCWAAKSLMATEMLLLYFGTLWCF